MITPGGTGTVHRLEFLLGLPALADTALWRTALRLGAPVLVSANALSTWRTDQMGFRRWYGFSRRTLPLVAQHPVSLDSGGFVAAVRYRGYPWTVAHYADLAAAAPWQRWFSLDLCVEDAVAGDREAVLDRISGTVRLNRDCRAAARRRGIADTFCPVIQGRHPDDYVRCIDRMFDLSDFPLVGVGSMCRRHVGGNDGILRVVDRLDRVFEGSNVRLHLFGLKTDGMAVLHGHPRVASVDSQAYGTAARWAAHKGGFPKTNAYLAGVMAEWHGEQQRRLAEGGYAFRPPLTPLPPPAKAATGPVPPWMHARVEAAMEDLRALHEAGEVEWSDVSAQRAWEWAFMDDLDDGQGRAGRLARQGARPAPLLRSPLPFPVRRSRTGDGPHGALRHDQAPVYRPRT